MSLDTFKKALELCDGHAEIGGGEPTIHPRFWEFLGLALGTADESVWLATNGKLTDTALALAGLARKGAIACELSRDEWHEDIDPRVVDAFGPIGQRGGRDDGDYRGVRDISHGYEKGPIRIGRAATEFDKDAYEWTEGCCCEGIIIDPKGVIWACGCKQVQYGTVDDPKIPDYEELEAMGLEYGECRRIL